MVRVMGAKKAKKIEVAANGPFVLSSGGAIGVSAKKVIKTLVQKAAEEIQKRTIEV